MNLFKSKAENAEALKEQIKKLEIEHDMQNNMYHEKISKLQDAYNVLLEDVANEKFIGKYFIDVSSFRYTLYFFPKLENGELYYDTIDIRRQSYGEAELRYDVDYHTSCWSTFLEGSLIEISKDEYEAARHACKDIIAVKKYFDLKFETKESE